MKNLKELSLFIVTGRTGHSLVMAKALPFAVLEEVKSIYLFSESEGFEIPKCKYITIPRWIKNARPSIAGKILRIFFEPLQLLYYAFKLNPYFINGVYCLPKGLNSYIVSRLSGVKCVNSVIGSILEIETELPFKRFWRSVNLWHLRGCEGLTIKGETDRKYLLSNGIDPAKMFQLNGAIDTGKFFFAGTDKTVDILYVGSFIELKGTERIIKIVEMLLPVFPDLKVVMAGEGALLTKIQKLAADLGVSSNISFEGYQKDTVPYFQKSRLLLMPSRSESMPTSMLEAMACGCVPVMSDVGNITQAAFDSVNSRVITDYNNLRGFAEAITDLLLNETERMKYALNGRKTVEEMFSVRTQSEVAENLISYLNQE